MHAHVDPGGRPGGAPVRLRGGTWNDSSDRLAAASVAWFDAVALVRVDELLPAACEH